MAQEKVGGGGGISYTAHYLYDSQMQLTTSIVQDSSFYTFTNGDNTMIKEGPFYDTLVYDLNKPAVIGNRDEFFQTLNTGATTIKNQHLLVSIMGTTTSLHNNAEGNISSAN